MPPQPVRFLIIQVKAEIANQQHAAFLERRLSCVAFEWPSLAAAASVAAGPPFTSNLHPTRDMGMRSEIMVITCDLSPAYICLESGLIRCRHRATGHQLVGRAIDSNIPVRLALHYPYSTIRRGCHCVVPAGRNQQQ